MSTPNISIDSEAVRAIVAKGIVESLSADQRTLLIQNAVDFLVTQPTYPGASYGRPTTGPSPLQEAFQVAVRQAANDVVKTMLAEDEVNAQVDAAIRSKVRSLLDEQGGWLYSTIGSAVGERIEQIMQGNR